MRSTALSFIFRFLLGFFFISHSFPVLDLQMTDVSAILGIALIGVGAASAVYGVILCYTTKVRKCAATTTQRWYHAKKLWYCAHTDQNCVETNL